MASNHHPTTAKVDGDHKQKQIRKKTLKTTDSSKSTKTSKLSLDREDAMHIQRFFHYEQGTSVMSHIYCETSVSVKETLFVGLYKSTQTGSIHAEAQMCKDIQNMTSTINNRLQQLKAANTKILRWNVDIFLSNSPCNQCATAIQRLRDILQSSLQCRFSSFNIQFAYLLKWKPSEGGLWQLHMNTEGISIIEWNWLSFYYSFRKLMELKYSEAYKNILTQSEPRDDDEVISCLMDLTKDWSVRFVKELTNKTKQDFATLKSGWWNPGYCHFYWY